MTTPTRFTFHVLLALLGLPLALHAQTATRTAPATPAATVAVRPCVGCDPTPIAICDITSIGGTQSNGPAVPLNEYDRVCSFNTVSLTASVQNQTTSPSYHWQVVSPTGTNAVANASGALTATFAFQPGLPGYGGPDLLYTVRCTITCSDGGTASRDFHFYSIPRAGACGQAIRPVAAAMPTLDVYPSPADADLTIALDGTYTASVLNSLGREVKRAEGQKNASRMSVANLPRGLYLLRLTLSTGQVVEKRFAVEH